MHCAHVMRTNTADWERTIGKTKRHIAHERLLPRDAMLPRYMLSSRVCLTVPLASTPPGMPGTHPPQYFGWGDVNGNIPPILLRTFGRFHSAIRRHQFASVRQADSRLTTLVPPNLELALTPLVRPSVCPSITSRYCIDMTRRIELVFGTEAFFHLSHTVL